MKSPRWGRAAALAAALALLAGCAAGARAPHHAGQRALGPPVNGKIVSRRRIRSVNNRVVVGARLYQIMYWSQGVLVGAYLTEPSAPGHYPLLVNLHGGYFAPYYSTSSFGYPASLVSNLINPNMVQLYPEYQGYMFSHGTGKGMATDNQDVLNAITAAESLGEVNPHALYFLGYSLGGGLALMAAGEEPAARAVAAVSPFGGFAANMEWIASHFSAQNTLITRTSDAASQYGSLNPQAPALVRRSPDVAAIHAPVLLLQGTADHHVLYEAVQLFASQLRAAHKTYRLILYPGGHHGLHHHNQAATISAIDGWLQQYGLNFSL